MLNVVAVSPSGATAHATRTVVFDFVPGTLLLDVTDPDDDDNGPGNYAYPTSADFHAGAFDIQRFQVFDDGTNIIFRVQTRDLSPTFGSPLGAQLVDVYVHDPGRAAATSTAASFPQRNYEIAAGSAWSRLIEVQGFGQRYVDAARHHARDGRDQRQPISRFITFSVPKATLGSPGVGLDVHRRPDRPGRLQPRPGAGLRADAAGLPVRRLRDRQRRPALHRRPEHRAEGDRRAHAARRARSPTSSTTRCTARSRSRASRSRSGQSQPSLRPNSPSRSKSHKTPSRTRTAATAASTRVSAQSRPLTTGLHLRSPPNRSWTSSQGLSAAVARPAA